MGCLHSKPSAHATHVVSNGASGEPYEGQKQKDAPEVCKGNEGDGESTQLMVVLDKPVLAYPDDEDARWDTLNSYNILDTEPEESYDRITKLCKSLFKVPIAMITFVDKERVWLKSVQGLAGLTEVDRRYSICAWTLMSRHPEALVVSDLREDIRFKHYPVVTGWPFVRFYAAAPLVTQGGQRLGTVCILDYKPRNFSAESALLLSQLSGMVMCEVEHKRAMNDALCNAALRTTGEAVATDSQGIMLVDAHTPKWSISLVNNAWQRATGLSASLAAGAHFWDLFEAPPVPQLQACRLAVEQRRNFELRVPCARTPPLPRPSGSVATSTGGLTPSADGSISALGSLGGGFLGADDHPGGAAHSFASGGSSGVLPGPPTLSLRGGGESVGGGSSYYDAGSRLAASAQRWVCLQFRSASSPSALCVAPAMSIPPTLMTQPDKQNYYWVTVDESQQVVAAGGYGDAATGGGGSTWSGTTPSAARSSWPGNAVGEPLLNVYGAGVGGSSGTGGTGTHGGGVTSDAGSEPLTPQRITTFNLLPEENPFQDITIGSLLGWGSYGRVHRGYWNGTLVAIKILEQIAGDFNPRTALEPLLHHRLSHPNIVKMFDISTQEVDVCEDGRPLQEVWMVLEYCSRGTLSDAITRGQFCLPSPPAAAGAPASRGVPDLQRIVRIAKDVASAMAYLHGQNVLHGDLNGNNILLVGPQPVPGAPGPMDVPVAKVADFGLSRLLPMDSDRIVTRTHGTITHMAPEVITESLHSKAADVYSFAVVLWELLTCAKPYSGMHYAQIVHAIAQSKGLEVPSAAPPGLQQLFSSCLAPRPEDRPQFEQVVRQLEELEASGVLEAADARAAEAAAAGAAEPSGAADDCGACTDAILQQAAENPPPPQAGNGSYGA